MGLSILGISSDNKISAKEVYQTYCEWLDLIIDLGSNLKMLTILQDMKNKFNTLKEEGYLSQSKDDVAHLQRVLDEAITIQIKPCKAAEDIYTFYNLYTNFNDICSFITTDRW